jgi:hypothetical protein
MAFPARIKGILDRAESPYTRTFVVTSDQFKAWGDGLIELRLIDQDEVDSVIPYWNLLAGIWVITEQEGESLTTTEAYFLVGQSKRSGQRYLGPAEDAGVVMLTPVKGFKKQKLVTLAPKAASLVKNTFDRWAERNGTLCTAILKHSHYSARARAVRNKGNVQRSRLRDAEI